jgi:arylesterase/paraoxonase
MYTQLWTNRPSNIKELNAFQSSSIKFEDLVRNCEDAVLNEKLGLAYLSCDPGRDRWNTVLVRIPERASTYFDRR